MESRTDVHRPSSDWANYLSVTPISFTSRHTTIGDLPYFEHSGFFECEKPVQRLCTGSSYEGSWNANGFSGRGKYTYPHGVSYEGYFKDGLFHGEGQFIFDKDRILMARFKDGKLLEDTAIFKIGNSEIDPKEFAYCKMPDRRFNIELVHKTLPSVGNEYLINSDTTRELPPDCFDVGNGIYDAKRNIILEDDGNPKNPVKNVRIPKAKEETWIKSHCRHREDTSVGYIPEFFEVFLGGRKWEQEKYGFNKEPELQKDNYEISYDYIQLNNQDSMFSINHKDSRTSETLDQILDNIRSMLDNKIDVKSAMPCGYDEVQDLEATESLNSSIEYMEKRDLIISARQMSSVLDSDLQKPPRKVTLKVADKQMRVTYETVEEKAKEAANKKSETSEENEEEECLSDVDFTLSEEEVEMVGKSVLEKETNED